jgi:hypothetical protein
MMTGVQKPIGRHRGQRAHSTQTTPWRWTV